MATLTIAGKQVEVGDEFLKLSPQQQNAAVADIAKQLGVTGGEEKSAAPITTNQVVRSLAEGVPLVGGVLNKMNAATAATVAPAVEPFMSPSAQDISRNGETWLERYRKSLAMQNAGDKQFSEEHPIADTAAKITGGVAGSIPMMMGAPAAFGLTGTMGQMVTRGAASNAAVGGADALIRGESPVAPALIGGVVGAGAPLAARAVGKLWNGIQELRNPTPPVPQTTETVAGVKIPVHQTADPAIEAEKEIMRRGARGSSAEAVARKADEEAQQAIAQATENIGAMLDPSGATRRTAPAVAGETVQSEIAAQEAARQASEAAQASRVAAQGESLARDLSGGAAPVSPFDAAERTGAAVAAGRNAAVARTREAYQARDAVPGTFDESVPRGMAEDIRQRLNTGENALWVDPTNESTANKALKLIDQTLGRGTGILENAVAPKPPPVPARAAEAAAPAKVAEDETVAALREKFGDSIADAYAKQAGLAGAAKPAEPPPLSLLEFIASKGGLKPDAELEAIGLNHGHRSQIPGQSGFFGTVRRNGSPIDRMREAAEEAGYLRGENGATSTPTQFLDALEAELRGQKQFPQGREGFQNKREVAGQNAREAAESERINQGFEADLSAAGHGALAGDMRQRAVALMRDEGMAADDAVETAFRQLEQEDAVRAAHAASDFPGDKPMGASAPAAAAAVKEVPPVDLRSMDEARKRLVTMYSDAKSAAIRSGDKSDMRAMAKILNEFDNVISDALASGKFTGDAALAKELQDAARKSHSDYRQTFSSRGPGDEVGRKVEKILGRYGDDAATAEQILEMSYGPKSAPGTGSSVKVGLRLKDVLGERSPEYAQWKQGVLGYVDNPALSPAARAARFDNFLQTSWAKAILTPEERAATAAYSRNLRAIEPASGPMAKVQKDIARIAGTDGQRPATSDEVTKMILADNGDAQRLLLQIKPGGPNGLTQDGWVQLKQGVFDHLLNAPAGHNDFTALQKAKRLSDYLASGKSKIINTAAERAEMAKLLSIFEKQVPLPGTTNPSGSATLGARILSKAGNNLMTMLGFAHGGVGGAVVGHGIDALSRTVREARAGKEATRLFFGEQPGRPVFTSRLPAIAVQGVPASQR